MIAAFSIITSLALTIYFYPYDTGSGHFFMMIQLLAIYPILAASTVIYTVSAVIRLNKDKSFAYQASMSALTLSTLVGMITYFRIKNFL